MLTEAELTEELRNLSLLSAAIDILTDRMALVRGRIWLDIKHERDRAESRYIAIYSQLYGLGYRIRYSVQDRCYKTINIFEGIPGAVAQMERAGEL